MTTAPTPRLRLDEADPTPEEIDRTLADERSLRHAAHERLELLLDYTRTRTPTLAVLAALEAIALA